MEHIIGAVLVLIAFVVGAVVVGLVVWIIRAMRNL